MENVKEKIRKLLALSASSNEHEARAALLKAKELMIKNKLSEADFEDTKDHKMVHLVSQKVAWTTDSGNTWMVDLSSTIAENYMCSAAWNHRKGSRTYTLVITGLDDDAELCKTVIEYAVEFVTGTARSLARRKRSDIKSVTKSYASGFIAGLKLAFEVQQEEHPEWALVVVKPDEVKRYEDGLGHRAVKTKKSDFDPLAYMKGEVDGKNFRSNKVLTEIG